MNKGPVVLAAAFAVLLTATSGAASAEDASTQLQTCAVADAGLISRWTADGTADDVVGGHDATPVGELSYAPGMSGGAFAFDGQSHLEVGAPEELRLSDEVTLSAWVKPAAVTGELQSLVVRWAQGGADAYGIWLEDGQLVGAVGVPGIPQWGLYAGHVPAGVWTHVSMTYSSSLALLTLYVGGVEVGHKTVAGGITPSDHPLLLGREASYLTRSYAGELDDAQVYATALSADQVAALATVGEEGTCPDGSTPVCPELPAPVGHWRGDGTGVDATRGVEATAVGQVSYVDGVDGQAFALDGSSHLDAGTSPALDLTGAMTLSAWVRPEAASGLQAVAVKWGQSLAGDAYGLWLSGSTVLGAVGVPGVSQAGFAAGHVSPSTWSHVAMTYTPSSGVLTLFVDGLPVAARAVPGGITSSESPLHIGHEASSEPRPFTGAIDDVRLYATALSRAQVAALASGGSCATPDGRPPVLLLPVDVTAEAQSAAGAPVSYGASAQDADGGALPVDCTPAAGSTFPLGATTVSCTATSAAGVVARGELVVTVVDTTAPVVTSPGDVVVDAAGPAGAAVTVTATARDAVDGDAPATCAPAGPLYPVGVTPVVCSAVDAHGNVGSTSLNVVVRGAGAQLDRLIDDVQGVGPGASFGSKLRAARDFAAAGDTTRAVAAIEAFRKQVDALAGKKLSTAQAAELRSAAARIAALLA